MGRKFIFIAFLLLIVVCISFGNISTGAIPIWATPTGTVMPSTSPVGQHNQGINPGRATDIDDWVFPEMQAAGAGWVRIEFSGGGGSPYFYESLIKSAHDYQLKVLGVIDYASITGTPAIWNENAVETGGTGVNQFQTDFVNKAVKPIISKYGSQLDAVEIWNEPNVYNTEPGIDGSYLYPSIYAGLLQDSYTAIKEIRPSLPVVMGGILAFDSDNGTSYFHAVHNKGQAYHNWGSTRPYDHVGYHLYIDQGGPTTKAAILSRLSSFRSAVNSWGGSAKKIWITEAGWQSAWLSDDLEEGEQIQASNLALLYQVGHDNQTALGLGPIFWYRINDYGSTTWGLMDVNGRKPSFIAFQENADY